jgi:hypothetical protein
MKPTMTRLAIALFLGLGVAVHSTGVLAASAEEIMRRSQHAFHYAGADARGKLTMELIDRDGGKRVRVLTMLRRNQEQGGDQKYFMYFHEPGDVRRLTFMVWKYPKREDDRWIFIPAVDLIRRIAAEDKYSSFVGSDFTYEDVSGRDVAEDAHTLLREEKLGDRDTFVIESTPRVAATFTKRVSWIDKQNFLPLREEYYDAQNELHRVFTADSVEDITVGEGESRRVYPTAMKRTMKNVKTGHRTEVTVTSVAYDLGLKDADFSERRMRRPPRAWIR